MKKNKIGQIGVFDIIMEPLNSKGLEGSEITSSIPQWRRSQLRRDNYKHLIILKSATILKNPWHPYI